MRQPNFLTLALVCLAGCAAATRTVLVNTPRPALTADQVQVYLRPPEAKYIEIANVYASSRGAFVFSTAAKIDKVVERLKAQAAKVGANGVLVHGVGSEAGGELGGGISTDSGRSPYVYGVGGSLLLHQEGGDGVAIYVEPH